MDGWMGGEGKVGREGERGGRGEMGREEEERDSGNDERDGKRQEGVTEGSLHPCPVLPCFVSVQLNNP